MMCNHRVSPKYEYYCILQPNHKGHHKYIINNKEVFVSGCCPDGVIAKYEA